MAGAIAGLLASFSAAVAAVLNKYFFFNVGGTGTNSLFSMQSDSSGNLYGINSNYEIISVAKDGTFRWAKGFRTTTGNSVLIVYRLFTVGDDIYIAGYTSPGSLARGSIIKLNTSGAIVWSTTFNNGMIEQVVSFGRATNGDILFNGQIYVYQQGYLDAFYRMNPSTGALISYWGPALTYYSGYIGLAESSTGKMYALLPDYCAIASTNGTQPIQIDHSTRNSFLTVASSGMVIDSSDFLYITVGYNGAGTVKGVGVIKLNPVTRAVVWSKILSVSATAMYPRTFSAGQSICIDSTNTYIYVFVGNCIAKLDLNGNIVSGWLRTMTVSSQSTNLYPLINITSDNDLIISNEFGAMKIKSDDTLSGVTTYTASFQTMTYQTTTQYSSTFAPTVYAGTGGGYNDPSGVTAISSPSTYVSATYSSFTPTTPSITLGTGNRYIYA
jgi:hypothetical protein